MRFTKRVRPMYGVRLTRWAFVALAVGWFHVMAGTALAQKKSAPPEDGDTLVFYGVMIGIVVLIGLTAFMNPKRSHQS